MITILDYGMGNLRSVINAFDRLGKETKVVTDLQDKPDRLVIPGVGAFGAAMDRIQFLKDRIHELAEQNVPILGICLGQQLLFSDSEEFGNHKGLELIPGIVRYLPKTSGTKIPHIGWNVLHPSRQDPLLTNVVDGDQAYFVHSLYAIPEDESCVISTTEYGIEFPSMVRKGSAWGCQFHPEKSGDVGLSILRQFSQC